MKKRKIVEVKWLQFSSWSIGLFFSIFLFISSQLLTATLAVVLRFFFFFFSLLIFLLFFGVHVSCYWSNLTLVRYFQFSPTKSPTWPVIVLIFFSFSFFFFNDIGFFPLNSNIIIGQIYWVNEWFRYDIIISFFSCFKPYNFILFSKSHSFLKKKSITFFYRQIYKFFRYQNASVINN